MYSIASRALHKTDAIALVAAIHEVDIVSVGRRSHPREEHVVGRRPKVMAALRDDFDKWPVVRLAADKLDSRSTTRATAMRRYHLCACL